MTKTQCFSGGILPAKLLFGKKKTPKTMRGRRKREKKHSDGVLLAREQSAEKHFWLLRLRQLLRCESEASKFILELLLGQNAEVLFATHRRPSAICRL